MFLNRVFFGFEIILRWRIKNERVGEFEYFLDHKSISWESMSTLRGVRDEDAGQPIFLAYKISPDLRSSYRTKITDQVRSSVI